MKANLLLIIFCLTTTIASAQWYIGIKAGPTLSNYKSKTPWKEVANLGTAFGATAFKQIDSHLGAGFELQYIQKGYKHKVCNTISDELVANYVEIPITVDYTFILPGLKNFKVHGNLGIYTAYWLSGKYKSEGFDGAANESFDFKKSKASRFDFGPNAGGRLEYILKNGSVSLDFRYELGMLDLQKRVNDNTKNTNRALVVGVSYFFLLGI